MTRMKHKSNVNYARKKREYAKKRRSENWQHKKRENGYREWRRSEKQERSGSVWTGKSTRVPGQ